jgi:hypothetical protein
MTRERAGLDGPAALLVGANEHLIRDIQPYHLAQLFWNVGGPLVSHIDRILVLLVVMDPTTALRIISTSSPAITPTTCAHVDQQAA